MNYETIVPRELWQQILVNVSPGDLCNVASTSKHMNDMACWTKLWQDMEVNKEKLRMEGLATLYSIERFKNTKRLNLENTTFTPGEIKRIVSDIPASQVENVNFSGTNLSKVPARMLARAISHLQTVNLQSTNLTTNQQNKILRVSLSSPKLINVNLYNIDLSKVPAELLAKAVARLETAILGSTRLTTNQCTKLLKLSLSSTTLINVNLCTLNLAGVPGDLLAKAISRLEIANLLRTHLTTEQRIRVCEATRYSTTLRYNPWGPFSIITAAAAQ